MLNSKKSKLLTFIRESEDLTSPEKIRKWVIDYLDLKLGEFKIESDNSITLLPNINIESQGVKLEELPIKINDTKGNIAIVDCKLTTLKGMPNDVGGAVNVSNNKLKTLSWCPSYIGSNFYAGRNQLVDLTGMPDKINGGCIVSNNSLFNMKGGPSYVGESFDVSGNKLKSIEGFPKFIGGDLCIDDNEITSLQNIHKHIPVINGLLRLDIHKIKDSILGLFLIKGLTYIKPLPYIITDLPKWAVIFNKHWSERGKEGIYDCQRELIDAGLEKYAKL